MMIFYFYKNNREKGVSLIISFFIMIIILTAVLFISRLFYAEIKMIRNISYSVVAFYAADSGIEKVFYYNRQILPEIGGGKLGERGLCTVGDLSSENPNACQADPYFGQEIPGLEKSIYCNDWKKRALDQKGEGCNPAVCSDCAISFNTQIGRNISYEIEAQVTKDEEKEGIINLNIKSKGKFRNVSRKIEVDTQLKKAISSVNVEMACVEPGSVPQDQEVKFLFSASGQIGGVQIDIAKARAEIRYSQRQETVELDCDKENQEAQCVGVWMPPRIGPYYVDIVAIDANKKSYKISNILACNWDKSIPLTNVPSFEVYYNPENPDCGISFNCTPYPTVNDIKITGPDEEKKVKISAIAFDVSGIYSLSTIIKKDNEIKDQKMMTFFSPFGYVAFINVNGWDSGEYKVSIKAIDSLMNSYIYEDAGTFIIE